MQKVLYCLALSFLFSCSTSASEISSDDTDLLPYQIINEKILFIIIGGIIYRDWGMISIASQANIGGGASAIALAEAFDRKDLILPAILVGSLGNALGTYLGFLVVYIL